MKTGIGTSITRDDAGQRHLSIHGLGSAARIPWSRRGLECLCVYDDAIFQTSFQGGVAVGGNVSKFNNDAIGTYLSDSKGRETI